MKKIKAFMKMMGLALLIVLALCGVGLVGADPFIFKKREQDRDHETKTELVEGDLEE
jgi:hypothetical protein